MDILDIKIVRIKDHDEESDLSLDTWFAVDADTYPPVPKKMSWQKMITYILTIIFSKKIITWTNIGMRAGVPVSMTFPEAFDVDYIILPSFVKYAESPGLEITDQSSTGFTMTSQVDTTVDITVIPITPIS